LKIIAISVMKTFIMFALLLAIAIVQGATVAPSAAPTGVTSGPTAVTPGPSAAPTGVTPGPSKSPSAVTPGPTAVTVAPSPAPSDTTKMPSKMPSKDPTTEPTTEPTAATPGPTAATPGPTTEPTTEPTVNPTASTATPSMAPYKPGTPSAAPTTSTAKPTLNPLSAQEIADLATKITDDAKAIFTNDWTFTADLDGVDIVADDTTVVTTFVASGDVTLKFTIAVTNTTGPVTEDQEMAIQTQVCAKMQAAISASTLTTFVDTKYACEVDVAATTRRRLLASITTDYEVSIEYTENPTTMAPTTAPIVNDGGSSKVCAVYGFLIAFVASMYL